MESLDCQASKVVPIGHATGPRTERGKRIASQNALRHGLYSNATVLRHIENQGEFERFARSIVVDLGVETALEMALAERLISALWRQRRARRYDTEARSQHADEAAALCEQAADARKRAADFGGLAEAIWKFEYMATLSLEEGEKAAEAIDTWCELREVAESCELFPSLDYARYPHRFPKTVTRRRFFAAVNRVRAVLPDELAQPDQATFLSKCGYALVAQSGGWSKKADDLDRKARHGETEALSPTATFVANAHDAEGRLDRQITRYIADLASIGVDVLQPPRRRAARTVS